MYTIEKIRENKVVVQKIIDHCEGIETILNRFDNSFDNYFSDKIFRYACDMCIIIIGELTARLTEDFKSQNFEIDWAKIKSTSEILKHDYENVELEKIWVTLTEDIPELKKYLTNIIFEKEQADELRT